jgi:radical SAM protein with 4Fe4S-binding SPASM domain
MSKYVQRVAPHEFRPWTGKQPLLGHLDIELTERCNNDCIHCCINLPVCDQRSEARELATDEVKRILREAAELGCMQVRYTGGEPLLREDFEELYLFARRLGIKVLLFTNARLITPRLADLWARIPPRVFIEVTVYGMRAESYEAVSRAPGSYAQFRQGVDLLLDRKVPFIVKQALLPANRPEMEEFEAWAATIPWMDKPPVYSMFFDLRNRRDLPAKNRQIEALRLAPEDGATLLARQGNGYLKEMTEFCGKFLGPPGDKLFACGAGAGGCVDAYGRLQPCMGVRAPGFSYDLRAGSLREAITDFFPRVLAVKATNPAYLERCARCFLKSLCEQCPAKSWAETGTLDTPIEYLCDVAHTQARRLGLLHPGERAWTVTDWASRHVSGSSASE